MNFGIGVYGVPCSLRIFKLQIKKSYVAGTT